MAERGKNIKLILKYVVGPLVFCILAVSIYHQVQRQPGWQQSFIRIRESITGTGSLKIWFVFLLMFINWGLEARKWQLSLRSLIPISFGQSIKAVFTGTTMAFFTPNRVGEYFGRILYIPEGSRLKAISLTIVCSMAQLLVTIGIGVIGLIMFELYVSAHGSVSFAFWLRLLLYASIAGGVILAFVYFRLVWMVRMLEKVSFLKRYMRYVKVLNQFNATILLRILLLSLIRYFVFLVQYYFLFQVFGVNMDWLQCFSVVSVMFIALAIAPTVAFLTDLGIRAKASIELVQFFSSNVVGILATSLSIWLINLVIPALIGSLLILGIRISNYQYKSANTDR